MKLVIKTLVLAFLASNLHAVTITCENSQKEAPTKLIVKADPVTHTASLSYENKEADDNFKIYIEEPEGIWDTSEVSIKSASNPRVLTINAQKTEHFRLSFFANFSLKLEQDSTGAFKAESLSMASGTEGFGESFEERSIKFENMSCVINS